MNGQRSRRVEVYKWSRGTPMKRELAGLGWFHEWGHSFDSGEGGPVGIVEMDDGTVQTPIACMIKFIDRPGCECSRPVVDRKQRKVETYSNDCGTAPAGGADISRGQS